MSKKEFLTNSMNERVMNVESSAENGEIIDLIQVIENKKQELSEAEWIVQFHPKIINNLEMILFKKLKGE